MFLSLSFPFSLVFFHSKLAQFDFILSFFLSVIFFLSISEPSLSLNVSSILFILLYFFLPALFAFFFFNFFISFYSLYNSKFSHFQFISSLALNFLLLCPPTDFAVIPFMSLSFFFILLLSYSFFHFSSLLSLFFLFLLLFISFCILFPFLLF